MIASAISAQSITEYYSSAYNTSGETLKQELNNIISNHREFSYTSSFTDVWDILKETDKDPENPNNVILLYSNVSVDAEQEYNNGAGWTREHVWAKSRGDFGTDRGAGTDVHHIRPESRSINSSRSNRNFKNCTSCNYLMYNGSIAGAQSTTEFTYEPNDNVKGDVARMIFYMAVRYEGDFNEPDLEIIDTLLSPSDKSPYHARITDMLEWNELDSVSNFEINRNNIIFNDYQENRNPFIDYPELAEYLFGSKTDQFWNPHHLAITNPQIDRISIFRKQNHKAIVVKNASNWNMEIYNTLGQKLEERAIRSNEEEYQLSYSGILIIKLFNGEMTCSKKVFL